MNPSFPKRPETTFKKQLSQNHVKRLFTHNTQISTPLDNSLNYLIKHKLRHKEKTSTSETDLRRRSQTTRMAQKEENTSKIDYSCSFLQPVTHKVRFSKTRTHSALADSSLQCLSIRGCFHPQKIREGGRGGGGRCFLARSIRANRNCYPIELAVREKFEPSLQWRCLPHLPHFSAHQFQKKKEVEGIYSGLFHRFECEATY